MTNIYLKYSKNYTIYVTHILAQWPENILKQTQDLNDSNIKFNFHDDSKFWYKLKYLTGQTTSDQLGSKYIENMTKKEVKSFLYKYFSTFHYPGLDSYTTLSPNVPAAFLF